MLHPAVGTQVFSLESMLVERRPYLGQIESIRDTAECLFRFNTRVPAHMLAA